MDKNDMAIIYNIVLSIHFDRYCYQAESILRVRWR